jgi:hypothetical protein
MLKEITDFIAAQSVALGFAHVWVRGTNLFAGHVPVKNALGVKIPLRYLAVLENAGGAVLEDVGGVVTTTPPSAAGDTTYWPKYIEKAVQLLNRAKTFFTARNDAEELYEALHNTGGWNLPRVPLLTGPRYQAIVIDAYGPPAPIENPGESGLYIFSTNYTWKIEETSC